MSTEDTDLYAENLQPTAEYRRRLRIRAAGEAYPGEAADRETLDDQADDTSALRPGNVVNLDGAEYTVKADDRGILFLTAPLGGEE